MMKRISWVLLVLIVLCTPVQAREMPDAIRDQIETSMLVTGSIDIATDGSTERLAIDQPEKLPSGVVRLLETATVHWRFEPVKVDGQPARVRTRMSVRVVARKAGGDTYSIALRGASFDGTGDDEGRVRAKGKRLTPPPYPQAAAQRGFQGTVFVIVRVGRDGQVEDAMSEQVNLTAYGTPAEMDAARKILAQASLRAARRWRFDPPTRGAHVDAPYWLARVPVDFMFGRRPDAEAYGQWQAYLPGERTPAPWGDEASRDASDAMVAGNVQMVGSGPRLLTPLEG